MAEIETTFNTARTAFTQWKKKTIPERVTYVSALRKAIVKQLDTIIAGIREDTGKVTVEVLNSDMLPTLELVKYYEKNAPKILATRKKKTTFLFFDYAAYLEYKPLGVVLIIVPWNCPFQLAIVPLVSALLAGNAVILKPSELTPRIGAVISGLCRDAGLPDALVQVIEGGKEVGEALIHARPDKIFFTGGVEAGKNIMALAAKNMTPVVLELGGKDPMIVFEDADIDRAAEAAVYGAFAHAGQLCVSVERLYVQESILDRFVSRLVKRMSTVRVGMTNDCDLGPVISPAQIEHIENQIRDARTKGATFLTDPMKQGSLIFPLALANANHQMKVMTEETFGPLLPIMPFKTEEEAIALANDSAYGLNASVWSQDMKKAKRVVRRLETGNACINDVIKNIGNPHLPFGGVKRSGFGQSHGPEGLRAFSIETAVMVNKNKGKREINWFPYTDELANTVKSLINFLYSDASFGKKLRFFLRMLKGQKKILR